ncbi:MAG: hypothetical protein ABIA93_01000 [Candidatus Woesearchaeota archaeon]
MMKRTHAKGIIRRAALTTLVAGALVAGTNMARPVQLADSANAPTPMFLTTTEIGTPLYSVVQDTLSLEEIDRRADPRNLEQLAKDWHGLFDGVPRRLVSNAEARAYDTPVVLASHIRIAREFGPTALLQELKIGRLAETALSNIYIESNGEQWRRSPVGAAGVAQLMPIAVKHVNDILFASDFVNRRAENAARIYNNTYGPGDITRANWAMQEFDAKYKGSKEEFVALTALEGIDLREYIRTDSAKTKKRVDHYRNLVLLGNTLRNQLEMANERLPNSESVRPGNEFVWRHVSNPRQEFAQYNLLAGQAYMEVLVDEAGKKAIVKNNNRKNLVDIGVWAKSLTDEERGFNLQSVVKGRYNGGQDAYLSVSRSGFDYPLRMNMQETPEYVVRADATERFFEKNLDTMLRFSPNQILEAVYPESKAPVLYAMAGAKNTRHAAPD